MTSDINHFQPDWVSSPGETIADLLEEQKWSQAELAERLGYSKKHVHLLIQGKAALTEDAALRLERTLGSTAEFWMNRESRYRQALARKQDAHLLKESVAWLKELPLKHLLEQGLIDEQKDEVKQVYQCLRFFGVASVKAWKEKYVSPLVSFRSAKTKTKKIGAVATWLRQCEKLAEVSFVKPYDRLKFKKSLQQIKSLTLEPMTEVFIPKLRYICSECGVIVVVVTAPKGCPVSGAAKWLNPKTALIMLSTRYKSDDQFWFSFFHEAAHILLHSKKALYVDNDEMAEEQKESEADFFARDELISPHDFKALLSSRFTKASIVQLAEKLGICPGIIVGRLQKEGLLPWTHLNGLKNKIFQ